MVSERCNTCTHVAYLSILEQGSNIPCCLYILDTGKARGCPAGDECDKYEEKDRVRMLDVYGKQHPNSRKWKGKQI